ncbi:MAG TPA: hypothetical protein DCR55_03010 [Lentisphaeria bacterium]|jgi:hypothetical protein|nr:hypothetical protein [Lentisphaeria bacterium]
MQLEHELPYTGLLAVDLGMRTGVACFDGHGELCWYQSRSLHKRSVLKTMVHRWLATPGLSHVAVEGGGDLATVWEREARRRQQAYLQFSAEDWRADLILPRDRRSGTDAKHQAERLALRVIGESKAPAPTGKIGDDVAEAILAGIWWLRHRNKSL